MNAPLSAMESSALSLSALLLTDRAIVKGFGGTCMAEHEGRALLSLEWDHSPCCPFADSPACLVICDAPVWAWRECEQSDWETHIYFDSREGWRAAWRLARLLANALPGRPALIDHESAVACVAILPGPRTLCRFELKEVRP